MHGSERPVGKEEAMMDCIEPADMKGMTTQRRQSTVKEQWALRMLGWERRDIVLASRRTFSRSALERSRSMDLMATREELREMHVALYTMACRPWPISSRRW